MHNRDIFSIFLNMQVCCVLSLESPHRGDSNGYTQYTIFNIKKKINPNYPKSAASGFFSKGFKHEFEIAVVNEPSGFKPLQFYCSSISYHLVCATLYGHVRKDINYSLRGIFKGAF